MVAEYSSENVAPFKGKKLLAHSPENLQWNNDPGNLYPIKLSFT